jgi:hypothetical protein
MSTEALRVRVEIFVAKPPRVGPHRRHAGPGCDRVAVCGLYRLARRDGPPRADITGQDVSVFSDHELVFPEGDSSDWDGPWLVRVPDDAVSVLAEVSDDELADFEARRTVDDARRDTELRDLCQQAMAERRRVYQWSTA